jgi:hypothetical protein
MTLVILPAFVPILAPLVARVKEVAFLALAEDVDGPEPYRDAITGPKSIIRERLETRSSQK